MDRFVCCRDSFIICFLFFLVFIEWQRALAQQTWIWAKSTCPTDVIYCWLQGNVVDFLNFPLFYQKFMFFQAIIYDLYISKLIELRPDKREDSLQRLKRAAYLAGLQGKQVVLYVPQSVEYNTLQDVCSLICEGKINMCESNMFGLSTC